MNEKILPGAEIIKKEFNDERKIRCMTPQEDRQVPPDVYEGGEMFTTENDEIIDLEFQTEDFTEYELVKYVELAEALYEKHKKEISIYIICPNYVNVYVKAFEIRSKASFRIILKCMNKDPAHILLDMIKDKFKNGIPLDDDDKEILKNLPEICDEKEKRYFRLESFRLLS